MRALSTIILALFMSSAFAEKVDFKIEKFESSKSFYTELKAPVEVGPAIQAFLKSSDLYKIRRDQWIFLAIDTSTQKTVGIGMQFQDGYDFKHIPANKIQEIKAGRFIIYTTHKNSKQKEIVKQLRKFVEDKKLKRRGDVQYMLLPAIKTKDDGVIKMVIPVE